MARNTQARTLAAIDVGTNAVRLVIARPMPDGTFPAVHQERDAIRPGEGVFSTGAMARAVADRLVATLRRYAALCRRHHARVRAVATSAVRESRNRDEIVRRAREEAGIALEVVSGREEARLVCHGVLAGRPPRARTWVIDVGGGSTEVALGRGERPEALYTVGLGAVRLTEIFSCKGRVSSERLAAMRSFAAEAFREALPAPPRMQSALGSSGTTNAIVAAYGNGRRIGRGRLRRAVEELAEQTLAQRRELFDPLRAEVVLAGAVVLEAALAHLGLEEVSAVDAGLRDGILLELARRGPGVADADRVEAAVALGRRFAFDEAHGRQVAALAVTLFDQLAPLHRLAASDRGLLEAAALLHDVGHAVSPTRHHKHTFYLVANADIPGFSDRERLLLALVARYHRRSAPERHREDLADLNASELRTVRRLVALLRVADALDRSHNQPVVDVRAAARGGTVALVALHRGPVDLELWDVAREGRFFRTALGKRLEVTVRRKAEPRPGTPSVKCRALA